MPCLYSFSINIVEQFMDYLVFNMIFPFYLVSVFVLVAASSDKYDIKMCDNDHPNTTLQVELYKPLTFEFCVEATNQTNLTLFNVHKNITFNEGDTFNNFSTFWFVKTVMESSNHSYLINVTIANISSEIKERSIQFTIGNINSNSTCLSYTVFVHTTVSNNVTGIPTVTDGPNVTDSSGFVLGLQTHIFLWLASSLTPVYLVLTCLLITVLATHYNSKKQEKQLKKLMQCDMSTATNANTSVFVASDDVYSLQKRVSTEEISAAANGTGNDVNDTYQEIVAPTASLLQNSVQDDRVLVGYETAV